MNKLFKSIFIGAVVATLSLSVDSVARADSSDAPTPSVIPEGAQQEAPSEAPNPSVTPLSFVSCVTTLGPLRKVNSTVEFGGSTTCTPIGYMDLFSELWKWNINKQEYVRVGLLSKSNHFGITYNLYDSVDCDGPATRTYYEVQWGVHVAVDGSYKQFEESSEPKNLACNVIGQV